MSEELFKVLDYRTATRENRRKAAEWVLDHLETYRDLLELSFHAKGEIAYKAAWVLEFASLKHLELLYPHLSYFFENISGVTKDQIIRPMAHLCELLAIEYYKKKDPELLEAFSEKHKAQMIECSFDWLISYQKVACQVRAMTSLYYLGTEFDWIHAELQQIIEQNIHKGSAGYKSRGRHTLEKILKFGSK